MFATGRLGRLREFDALVLTALIWFLAKFLRYAFPPLFGTFQDVYHVSNTTLGAAFTALMLVYAAMQFPSGALADRLGAVRVITAGAVVAAGGALLLSIPLPFVALIGAMLLIGLGTGAHKTVAVRLLSRTYPARTGRALGVLDTFGAFGGVVAPAVVVALLNVSANSWKLLFLGSSIGGIGLAIAFRYQVPKRTTEVERSTPDGESASSLDVRQYLGLFRNRRFTLFVVAAVLFSYTYNGVVAFLPLYLTREAGLSPDTANLIYSSLFAVSLVQMATGEVSDRIGQLPVISATLGLAATSLAALLFVTGPVPVAITVIAFGLGSHGFRPVRGAYLMAVIPDDVAGGTLGIVRTALMAAGAIAPAIVGYLSDTIGFRAGFGMLAGSLVITVLLVSLLIVQSSKQETT